MDQEMVYVHTVYQEGSFSKAAEKLYMTQPALSIAIRKAENGLGAMLFDRSRHPLRLTDVGEIYIKKYHEIKILEKELASQISDIRNLQKGKLIIGGTHFILSYVLAPVLSEFSSQYPNIKIRLLESSSDKLETLLTDGSIDLCLKCNGCASSLRLIDFAFRDDLFIAVPKDYVARYGLPETGLTLDMVKQGNYEPEQPLINLSYLTRLPFLVLTEGNNLHERFMKLFEQAETEPNIIMQIEQIVTAYHLANSGIGATLTSAIIIRKSLCDNLLYYKVDSPLMIRDFYVIGRDNRYISDANMRFIKMLKTYYS